MKENNRIKIYITIMLTLIETLVYWILISQDTSWVSNDNFVFLTYVAPMGFIFFINYYILAPAIYSMGMSVLVIMGYYKIISKKYNKIISKCIAWLVNLECHWGAKDTDKICQNANLCEGLIAIKKAGFSNRYHEIYYEAFQTVLENTSENGMESKSLKFETVVCTSLALSLFALERKENSSYTEANNDKFEKMAENLFASHGKNGWGVFVEKVEDNNWSMANTFRALGALLDYDIAKDKEYSTLVKRVYENNVESLFGFTIGDTPRLCTTAMSIILYFRLDKTIQSEINISFDVKKAIKYVFEKFCYKGVEYESEYIKGVEKKSGGVKKVPWSHLTAGISVEALVVAYKNKELNLLEMDLIIMRINKICKKSLQDTNKDEKYIFYTVKGMQTSNDGNFTYPTAYLVWGLSSFDF